MGRRISHTWGGIKARCTLQNLLIWTVVLGTIIGFFLLFQVHGIFKAGHRATSGGGSSWFFEAGAKAIPSLSKKVDALQVTVGRAIERNTG
jgi:hypothetical protein